MFEGILVFVLLLGVLIFVHELGHFLVAKKIGVYVHKFSLGFGPKLFAFKGKETEYVFSPILLGGYVKMAGELPKDEKADEEEALSEEDKEYLAFERNLPADRRFFNRSVGERIAIVAAGPLTNYILGIIVLSLIFMIGIPSITSRVGDVKEGFPAHKAGIIAGDLITEINGEPIWRWQDLVAIIQKSAGKQLRVEVERDGQKLFFDLAPIMETEYYQIGINISEDPRDVKYEHYGPLKAVWMGCKSSYDITAGFFSGLSMFFSGEISPTDMVAGPIGIYKFGEKMARQGVRQFLYFFGLISINLAIINLFPIHILDGGQIVFYLIEKFRGQPLSIRVRELSQQVGLVLLMFLIAFAFYSDIVRSY